MAKLYSVLFVVKVQNLKNIKYHTSQKKHEFFLLFAISVKMKMKKCFQEKNQLKYYKFLVQLIIQKSIRKYKVIPDENMNQEFKLKI